MSMLAVAKGAAIIASIGECMVEFRQVDNGLFAIGFGGDTLNTAIYLARLGMNVDYITALGDDAHSKEMMTAWAREGVGTDHIVQVPGATPGLYVIQVDEKGERSFSYWRDHAPARKLFSLPSTEALSRHLSSYTLLYVSGISMSLYGDEGRETLLQTLVDARKAGARVAFDSNFRARGWPDRAQAEHWFARIFGLADIIFASTEDLQDIFGQRFEARFRDAAPAAERVLKYPDLTVRVETGDQNESVVGEQAKRVVDTTAAGDSFAAAYLSARLTGASIRDAALAGHRLASQVVGFPGAIIPQNAMGRV